MEKQKVILLHGWATDQTVWRETHLDSFDCLDLTLPGHSLTSPSRWINPTLDDAVEKLLEDTNGQDGLVGIGWSLGGQVLIEATIRNPEKFKALVLVGVSPRFTSSSDFPMGLSPLLVKRMRRDIKAKCVETLKNFYKLNFTDDEAQSMEAQGFIKYYKGIANFVDNESLCTSLEALYNLDLRDNLKKIDIPTLIIHGDKDNVCPVEAAEYLKDNIANSTLKIYKNSGHAPFITESSKFNKQLEIFLKTVL